MPHKKQRYPQLPRNFRIEKYAPRKTYELTHWDWAFQIAVRRSCWHTVQSITKPDIHEEVRATIVQLSRIDKAIEMILSKPILSWEILQKYQLDESHFWHLTYLLENTFSGSPAISIPTIGEIQELARRAQYIAKAEPERLQFEDIDEYTGELIQGELVPEYVGLDAFIENPLVLFVTPGSTPTLLKREFGIFIDNLSRKKSAGCHNPNNLKTSKIADLRVLPYIDLKIWAAYAGIDFLESRDLAFVLFESRDLAYKIDKQTSLLAERLLDSNSNESQQLLAYAAWQRHLHGAPTRLTRRGRRPKKESLHR